MSAEALTRRTAAPRPSRVDSAELILSRVFCAGVGGFLILDTIAALAFTRFELSVGDDLPHQAWTFFFAFNTWHHLLHLVTSSVLLVAAWRREWAPVGALAFGAVYVVLAPAGFLDGDDAFDVFYSAWRENVVHALLAVQGVAFGWLGLRALRR